MKPAFAVLAALVSGTSWLGCGTDRAAPGGTGDDDGSDPGTMAPGTGPVTAVSGEIKADATWTDTIHVTGKLTIDKGVTVTVAPGTVVNIDQSVGMSVAGTLAIQGTQAARVTFQPSAAGEFWSDIMVPAGGAVTASYLVQTGGNYYIAGTGSATFTDSQLSHAGGDLMVMAGGTLHMTYSQIGVELGHADTTHCDLHVANASNGAAPSITVTHSNISTSAYGIMYYGGINADFTYNNWFGNTYDIETLPADPVSGDFSYGYFAKGAPSSAGVTATHLSTQRITDAGVR